MGIAKRLSIILPSPGVVLGEGHEVQIIKQAFHSLSQLPTMAWEPMPAPQAYHVTWAQSGPLFGSRFSLSIKWGPSPRNLPIPV